MTDADLDRIESALDLKVPAFYRAYMRNYPRWLVPPDLLGNLSRS